MTAEEILRASLADIEAGHWCGGKLASYGQTASGLEFTHSYVGVNTSEWGPFREYDQPKGCAMGLLALHGLVGYDFEQQVDGVLVKGFCPTYISETFSELETNEPVVAALIALWHAIPEGYRSEAEDLAQMEAEVVDFNDARERNPQIAADWFRRALASVTEKAAV